MYKHNWKKIIAIFVFISTFFSACRAGDVGTQAPTEPATITVEATNPEPIPETLTPTTSSPPAVEDIYQNIDPTGQVISFWHPYTGDQETILLEIIQSFNQSNEWNIRVNAVYQGSQDDLFDKMLTFMNTPQVPTLIVAAPHQSATYQIGKSLVDMNELVYSPKWGLTGEEIDDFFPGFFSQDVFPNFDNVRLGFPTQGSMEISYYNQDWMKELGKDEPPVTPEDFKEMACAAAHQPYSGATAEGSTGYQMRIDATLFASLTYAFGGQIFDYEQNQFTYDRSEAVAAMQFIQTLINEGCANLVNERGGDQVEFSQGTTLFTIASSSELPFYQRAVTAGANHGWSVTPVPYRTSKPVQNISAISASIPKTNSERQLAAWLFLKFLTSPEIQARWASSSGYLPVRANAAAGLADYFSANPGYSAAFKMLPFGIAEPAVAGYDPVRDMVAEAMYAISQGADVLDTLTALNSDANALLEQQLTLIPEPPDPWIDVDPSGQTVIFWHQQPPVRHNTLNDLIWKFNSTNKWGISVVPEYQDDINEEMKKVTNSSQAPNLVEIFQDQAADLQLSQTFTDMTSLVASIKWGLSPQEQADFFPGIFNQDIYPTFNNARLGFPPHRSIILLYYNADWLAELKASGAIDFDGPPQTPEQFKAATCAAVENPFSQSLAETSIGYQFNIDASHLASWTFAFGGDVFDYENEQFSYNDQGVVAAMSYLQDLLNQGCATLPVERYGDQTDFSQGALLFTVGSSAGLPFYQAAIAEGDDFNWSVAALPHTTDEPVSNAYGASLSMTKGTPESELATWLFVKYFVSPEVQAQWVQASNYLPVRSSAAEGMVDFLSIQPEYATAFKTLPNSITEPSVPGYNFVRGMVEEAMVAIIAGEDVQSTLDQLNLDANLHLAEQIP